MLKKDPNSFEWTRESEEDLYLGVFGLWVHLNSLGELLRLEEGELKRKCHHDCRL